MTDTLSIGWTRATADGRRTVFRRVLAFNLALQSLVAIYVLIDPTTPLALFGISGADAEKLTRLWVAMVVMASALQLPGLLEPIYNRLPNIIGILGRVGMTILYIVLAGPFLWLAAFDGFFTVALYLLYRRAIIAELQTRP